MSKIKIAILSTLIAICIVTTVATSGVAYIKYQEAEALKTELAEVTATLTDTEKELALYGYVLRYIQETVEDVTALTAYASGYDIIQTVRDSVNSALY